MIDASGRTAAAAGTPEEMKPTYRAVRERGYADLATQDIADGPDESKAVLDLDVDAVAEASAESRPVGRRAGEAVPDARADRPSAGPEVGP